MKTYQISATVGPDGSLFIPIKCKKIANHNVKLVILDMKKSANAISESRGRFKGQAISSKEYFNMKKQDKILER